MVAWHHEDALMNAPRSRRRWIALAVAVLLAVVAFRLLDQPLRLESYRAVDQRTLDVLGYGPQTWSTWTHVTGITETATSVTISVNLFVLQIGAGSSALDAVHVPIHLSAPLGQRTVIDGSTGQTIPASG